MHLLESTETTPGQTRRPVRGVAAKVMAAMAAAFAMLMIVSSPASAATGTFKGDWYPQHAEYQKQLKRTATCIVVTYQNTGKTGSNLTECAGNNTAAFNSHWDRTDIFKYTTQLDGRFTWNKSSNGCPSAGRTPYIKCIFINSANIVVTVSGSWACCPSLTKRGYDVAWSRINP